MTVDELRTVVDSTWADLSILPESRWAVEETIDLLDRGQIRTAEPSSGAWIVNEWVKKAIVLWLKLRGHGNIHVRDHIQQATGNPGFGEFQMKSVKRLERVWMPVPAVIRHGAFIGNDARLSPCFINMGVWIGQRSLIANNASIGLCAQVGSDAWVSAGASIGSVMLMPLHARPVIIEDNVYVGMHCVVSEGTDPYFAGPVTMKDEGIVVGAGAILGAGVVINGATPIIDVTGAAPREIRGTVPRNAVVVRGNVLRSFPSGDYQIAAALLVGWRDEGSDPQRSLHDALHRYGVDA